MLVWIEFLIWTSKKKYTTLEIQNRGFNLVVKKKYFNKNVYKSIQMLQNGRKWSFIILLNFD